MPLEWLVAGGRPAHAFDSVPPGDVAPLRGRGSHGVHVQAGDKKVRGDDRLRHVRVRTLVFGRAEPFHPECRQPGGWTGMHERREGLQSDVR